MGFSGLSLVRAAAISMLLVATSAWAGEAVNLEKVKTGILPNGGFYSIYEVTCMSEGRATIGAMSRRGGPWCAEESGELVCFRRSEEAMARACTGLELVANEASAADMDAFQ